MLHFGIFDSEMIWFTFFCDGKVAAKYSDEEFSANKKLYDIPGLVGYGDGQKKRLSTILQCADVDLKVELLEEYLGVCLCYHPDLLDAPHMLFRDRSDACYQKHLEAEKRLTGKAAPMAAKLVAEYPGKLFWDFFALGLYQNAKPHCFLYGYEKDGSNELAPVRFVGSGFEAVSLAEFMVGRAQIPYMDPRFDLDYETPCKVTFSDECPAAYRGKVMTLPSGFYPEGFLSTGELLLQGNHRILIVDSTLKIIAKLSVKGDIADILDDYILTTTGDSFCGYCYEPKAKVYIYKIMKNN